jgi:hypothetical protein
MRGLPPEVFSTYAGVGKMRRYGVWGIIVKKAAPMTVQITKPEVEAIIKQRLETGGFKDAEDVVSQALQSLPATALPTPQPDTPPAKDMVEFFAPLRGLNLDFGGLTRR